MQALVWTAKGEEFETLASQPSVCGPRLDDPQTANGMALFNAPQLLGGQAARAGVSCASCHSNGRRNAHFFLAGVSDGPGTADVSSSFFNLARANGRFDPKAIPDLASPGKISRDPRSGELERFLRGLIVEEFGGREPSPAALAALASYVRAVRPCPNEATESRTIAGQLALVRITTKAAQRMAEQGEGETAILLTSAARHQLGLIDERLAQPGLERERRMLLAASRALQAIADAPTPDPHALAAWLNRFDHQDAPRIDRIEAQTLYNPARLHQWLQNSSDRR
jgi:hypothetical protein